MTWKNVQDLLHVGNHLFADDFLFTLLQDLLLGALCTALLLQGRQHWLTGLLPPGRPRARTIHLRERQTTKPKLLNLGGLQIAAMKHIVLYFINGRGRTGGRTGGLTDGRADE